MLWTAEIGGCVTVRNEEHGSEDVPLENTVRTRLETKAIVLGYAMSRLDRQYLGKLGYDSWQRAFEAAAAALDLPPATFKNLRDEFDPVHPNPRMGWHNRVLRASRQRVLDELREVSNEGLSELIQRILRRDDEPVLEAIDSLSVVTRVAHNVAERLLTGRRAEEYFLENSERLVGVSNWDLIDLRDAARGYDFGVSSQPDWAIEVKGLRALSGSVQFTDREWSEAGFRGKNYWVVIVGGLATKPTGEVIKNPHVYMDAKCRFQKTVCAVWQAHVSVGGIPQYGA